MSDRATDDDAETATSDRTDDPGAAPRSISSDGVATTEAFQQQLHTLLAAAYQQGVPIEQHWAHRSDDDLPDWEVEVVRLKDESE